MRVELLGAAAAVLDDGRVVELRPTMRDQALAYLAWSDDWVSRDRLGFLFWADLPDATVRHNVRQLLKRIRQLEWIDGFRHMTVDLWREVFEAAPTELRDLLSYVHDPTLQPASRLLRGEPIDLEFEIFDEVELGEATEVQLVKTTEGPEPRAWVIERSSTPIGVVASSAHMSVETLTSLGTPIRVIAASDETPRLTVTTAES